jgi:hypothetical protein
MADDIIEIIEGKIFDGCTICGMENRTELDGTIMERHHMWCPKVDEIMAEMDND